VLHLSPLYPSLASRERLSSAAMHGAARLVGQAHRVATLSRVARAGYATLTPVAGAARRATAAAPLGMHTVLATPSQVRASPLLRAMLMQAPRVQVMQLRGLATEAASAKTAGADGGAKQQQQQQQQQQEQQHQQQGEEIPADDFAGYDAHEPFIAKVSRST
jgi:hypothetical protein